jgi:endonuclease/exonuclease/phosphatase family metal-dependent hydrolase
LRPPGKRLAVPATPGEPRRRGRRSRRGPPRHGRGTTAVRLSAPDADEAVVASVHLDHDSPTARERGASLLANRFGNRGDPTVVAGGFNCTPADRADFEVFLDAVRSLDGADLRGSRRGLDGRAFRISSV